MGEGRLLNIYHTDNQGVPKCLDQIVVWGVAWLLQFIVRVLALDMIGLKGVWKLNFQTWN